MDMPQKGLTIDMITKSAAKLIEEKGYDQFSLRELATRLDVKAASLYNHVSGIKEISTAVGLFAIGQLNRVLP
jgi:AcrR family transcriptional regulator